MYGRLTMHKLEVFCRVKELGSLTRAAETLYIAQPAVSAHLKSLDEIFGVKLFRRRGRGLVLTPSGERVYAWASETMTRAHELERELEGFRDGAAGTCVVAASMTAGSYALPSIVTEFRRDHPNALVRVNISNPDGAMDAVRAGACDFGVVIVDPRHPTEGLQLEKLCDEELVLIGNADHRERFGAFVRPADLKAIPFVTSPRGVVRRDTEDLQLRALGVERETIEAELGHPEAMKRAVADGLGLAFLLRSSVESELAAGTLCQINVLDFEMTVPAFLVHRVAKQLSPVQEAFADAVRHHFVNHVGT